MKNATMMAIIIYLTLQSAAMIDARWGRECWTTSTNDVATVTCSQRGEPK